MENKHFSHVHGLVYHQTQQGADVQCSGCKFPASGNIYACWQCSFFLHEQCFHASRSLKHPSHPTHPLHLSPYPTYPTNSFCCDSCNLVGNGFCYCCSECGFDLHIHCALKSNPVPPSLPKNASLISPNPDFSKLNLGENQDYNPQPAIPVQQTQNINHIANFPPPYPPPAIETGGNYQSSNHHSSTYPNPLPPNNSPVSQSYPGSIPQNRTPNPPLNSPYPPSVTSPTNFPNGYPEVNIKPHPTTASSSAGSTFPATSITSSQEKLPPNPETSAPNVKEVKHFSHPHLLKYIEIARSDEKVCSGCENYLVGSAYTCIETECNFNLHKSCFESPLEIRHSSHPDHPLKLLAKPPSHYFNNQFTCDGCLLKGAAFVYNCTKCSFDIHVNCVSLPESIIRQEHEHPLKLLYSTPVLNNGVFICGCMSG